MNVIGARTMNNELARGNEVLAARAARKPARGKAKLYCPIRLVQTHHSLLGALLSLGLNNDEAYSLSRKRSTNDVDTSSPASQMKNASLSCLIRGARFRFGRQ